MHDWIAVDFRGGRLKDAASEALGQTQHVDGAVHARLGGLYRVVLIMDRRGRAGQIVDFVHLDIKREGDVVPDELEALPPHQMVDVALCAGEKIIGA